MTRHSSVSSAWWPWSTRAGSWRSPGHLGNSRCTQTAARWQRAGREDSGGTLPRACRVVSVSLAGSPRLPSREHCSGPGLPIMVVLPWAGRRSTAPGRRGGAWASSRPRPLGGLQAAQPLTWPLPQDPTASPPPPRCYAGAELCFPAPHPVARAGPV